MRTFFGGLFLILGLAAIALAQEGGRTLDQPAAPAQHPDGTISYVAKDGNVTLEVKGMDAEGSILLSPLDDGLLRMFCESRDGHTSFNAYIRNVKSVTLKNVQLPLREVKEDGKEVKDPAQRTWTLVSGNPLPNPEKDAESTYAYMTGDTVWTKENPRELMFTENDGRSWRCTSDLMQQKE